MREQQANEALRPENEDLAVLIGDMKDLLERTLGSIIAIEVELPPDLSHVLVNAHQFELVLPNLAVNAHDAMPQGVVLRLEHCEEVHTASSVPPSLKPGTCVRITVTDTGSGMSLQTLARAVEPFYTTKSVSKGTGLGLATVQGLAGQPVAHQSHAGDHAACFGRTPPFFPTNRPRTMLAVVP